MQLATVIGHASATIKHSSYEGWRLVLVQPLDIKRLPEGDPLLAFGKLNPGVGQIVVLNSDGQSARQMMGIDKTPARWHIVAIVDEKQER